MLTALVALVLAAGPGLAANPATVTQRGNPVALLGPGVSVGDVAPDFTALDDSFRPVALDSFRGHPVLISAVPSLETKVCTLQTERFNRALAELAGNFTVITVSMDLPTAQARFCGAHDIDKMVVLSDSARREFGQNYGVLIPEKGLLARSVFVIDAGGVVRYVQIVPEMTHQPDYDAALDALQKLIG
jgi:thiol peroxidase